MRRKERLIMRKMSVRDRKKQRAWNEEQRKKGQGGVEKDIATTMRVRSNSQASSQAFFKVLNNDRTFNFIQYNFRRREKKKRQVASTLKQALSFLIFLQNKIALY